jgi:hypothetical protein
LSLFTKLKSPNYSEKSNPNEKTKKKKKLNTLEKEQIQAFSQIIYIKIN